MDNFRVTTTNKKTDVNGRLAFRSPLSPCASPTASGIAGEVAWMSGGQGRIERAIRELFDAYPDRAFTTSDLYGTCYPAIEPSNFNEHDLVMQDFDHEHRVAVLRAAHKLVAANPNWRAKRAETAERGWVFFNQGSLRSCTQAQMITNRYCGQTRCAPASPNPSRTRKIKPEPARA